MTMNPLSLQTNKVYLIASDDFHYGFIDGSPSGHKIDVSLASQIGSRSIYNYMFKKDFILNKFNLDLSMPFLNFGGIDKKFIDSGLLSKNQVYNQSELRETLSDKRHFHKFFKDRGFIPKTRLSKTEAIEDLEFPVVGKPPRGLQGKGIIVFDTPQELQQTDLDPEYVFCEKIDIVDEYRMLYFKSEMVQIAKRTPINEKAKAIRESKTWYMSDVDILSRPDKKMEFDWSLERPVNDILFQMDRIAKMILDEVGLDYAGIDFAVDSSDGVWVIEGNSAPGLKLDFAPKLYRAVYRDWYKLDVNHYTQKILDDKAKELISLS